MKRKELDALYKSLRIYFHTFPYEFRDTVLEIFSDLEPGEVKDSILVSYLDKIEDKKNTKGQLMLDYVVIFEKLFFFLTDKKHKEKYSKVLLDVYLVRFSYNQRFYKKKIQRVQEFLGKELTDLPQFKKEKSFLSLHLGSKKIFSIISSLLSSKK